MKRAKRDYYEVLGVRRDADAGTIKRAFRSLAREVHPDVSAEAEAKDRFSELAEAYRVLSKPTDRLLYDRYGYLGRGNGGFRSASAEPRDPFDRFASLVEIAELEIEAVEAKRGTTRKIRFTNLGECSTCGGGGAAPGSALEPCSNCRGEGRRTKSSTLGSARLLQVETCAFCRGSGRVVKERCATCDGTGRVETERTVSVEIPPGTKDGTRIRVRADAHAGTTRGGSGDVYVILRVLPERDSRVTQYSAVFALVVALTLFLLLLLSPDSLVGRL